MNFIHEKDRIYAEDQEGKVIAEVTFPEREHNIVDIDHTFVDSSLRGQGIAGKLMEEVVSRLHSTGQKAICTCPYAVTWFKRHPEYSDLLANSL